MFCGVFNFTIYFPVVLPRNFSVSKKNAELISLCKTDVAHFWIHLTRENKQRATTSTNRPFPSSCLPPLQSESKCEVFVMVISSTLHMNENQIFITKTSHLDSL